MILSGKVALVTGAISGIGLQITRELLKTGIQGVSLLDINESVAADVIAKLSEEFGKERVVFYKTDVTKMKELEDAFARTVATFGYLDIVVNNAGIANDIEYELEIDINLNGVVRGTVLGLKYMSKNKGGQGGVILNISSQIAFIGQFVNPVYAATKAGILNLSRGFGHQIHFARTGVKVICICPGRTNTEISAVINIIEGDFDELRQIYENSGLQPVEIVGKAAAHVIQHGESASVWMISESKLHQLDISDWTCFVEHTFTFNAGESSSLIIDEQH